MEDTAAPANPPAHDLATLARDIRHAWIVTTAAIPLHETIDYSAGEYPDHGGEQAFCKWFYDHVTSNYQRICLRLGGFCEVPPPPDPRTRPDTSDTEVTTL